MWRDCVGPCMTYTNSYPWEALGGNSLAMLSPLFLLYLVLGDTSGKTVQCTKGLRLPISEVFV